MNFDLRFAIPLIILLCCSCDDAPVDVVPPEIEELNYNPMPNAREICGSIEPVVFELSGGDVFSFDVIFNDNEALSQYKVDIHNNFDCHGHGGGVAPKIIVPNVNNQTTDWSVLDIYSISGTSVEVSQTLEVPENITAGNYHFHLQVLDESGNDSPFSNFYSIKIEHPMDNVPPEIHVQYPTDGAFSMTKGETMRFAGTVTDNLSLSEGGNGILYLAYTDLSSGNSFTSDVAFPFDEDVDQQYDFDFEYVIPQTLVSGNYRFSLGAHDGVRNVAEFIFFDVQVNN